MCREPGGCLFQDQLVLPQLLVLLAETLQFVGFRLVESTANGLTFNPLLDRRFARFVIVRQRSNRTALIKFQDDLFSERLWISLGHVTPLLAKMHGKRVCTFSLIPQKQHIKTE